MCESSNEKVAITFEPISDEVIWRMCGTCGYECVATLDKADDEHMNHDGAHYALWYTADELIETLTTKEEDNVCPHCGRGDND
jgi:hypothetical protein